MRTHGAALRRILWALVICWPAPRALTGAVLPRVAYRRHRHRDPCRVRQRPHPSARRPPVPRPGRARPPAHHHPPPGFVGRYTNSRLHDRVSPGPERLRVLGYCGTVTAAHLRRRAAVAVVVRQAGTAACRAQDVRAGATSGMDRAGTVFHPPRPVRTAFQHAERRHPRRRQRRHDQAPEPAGRQARSRRRPRRAGQPYPGLRWARSRHRPHFPRQVDESFRVFRVKAFLGGDRAAARRY